MLLRGQRHEGPLPPGPAQKLVAFLALERRDQVQPFEKRIEVAGVFGNDDDLEIVAVGGDHVAEPVVDISTRRRDQLVVDPVLFGQRRILVGIDHLQLIEPRRQKPERADLKRAEHDSPAG